MVSSAKTKIVKNPKAHTQYITIPAVLAQDSAYKFKEGDEVEVQIVMDPDEVDVEKGSLLVKRSHSPASSKGK